MIASNLVALSPPTIDVGQLTPSSKALHAASRTYGVLVVDDDACVRGVLSIGMRQQGFAVWVAADGQAALDLYWRHRESIDVVLMDVRMPGMDGPQTLAALQELSPRVRCCFMSGDLGDYTTERLRDLGVAAVFSKPFDLAVAARRLLEVASGVEITLRATE